MDQLNSTLKSISDLIQQPALMVTFFLCIAIWPLSHLAILGHHGVLLPLTPESFRVFQIWNGEFRIVFPDSLLQIVSISLSLLGPAIAILLFFLIRATVNDFSKAWARLLSFSILCLLFPTTRPDVNLQLGLQILFYVAILSQLVQTPLPSLRLWIIGTPLVLLAILYQTYGFSLLWILLSGALAFLFHFFFIMKMRVSTAHSRESLWIGLRWLGFICFSVWALSLVFLNSGSLSKIGQSGSLAWLAFAISGLSIVFSYFEPQKAILWMLLSSISFGAFFSQELDFFNILILSWLLLYGIKLLLSRISEKHWIKLPLVKALFSIGLIAGSLTFLFYNLNRPGQERTLSSEWIPALYEINSKKIGSSLLIGDSIEFLQSFSDSKFYQSDELILEPNETHFQRQMTELGLEAVLINKEYLKEFWKTSIAEGIDPKRINESVISRILLYQGKAEETQTLKLESIKDFEVEDIKGTSISLLTKLEKSQ